MTTYENPPFGTLWPFSLKRPHARGAAAPVSPTCIVSRGRQGGPALGPWVADVPSGSYHAWNRWGRVGESGATKFTSPLSFGRRKQLRWPGVWEAKREHLVQQQQQNREEDGRGRDFHLD